MAHRPLLACDQWAPLVLAPIDEENLIRHYTLGGEDILRSMAKRGDRNRLGFAVQLCFMRFPGRPLLPGEEVPQALLSFVGEQLAVSLAVFADYARRDQTRREHIVEIQKYLSLRTATREDRRSALLAAIEAAAATDKGRTIAEAIVKNFHDRRALLPSTEHMDRIGRAGRAIARKRAHRAILKECKPGQQAVLDALLSFDPSIRKTRFGWLGEWSDSPGAANVDLHFKAGVDRQFNPGLGINGPICGISCETFAA